MPYLRPALGWALRVTIALHDVKKCNIYFPQYTSHYHIILIYCMQIGVRYDLYLVNVIHSHYGNTALTAPAGSGDYDVYTVN